MHHALQFVDFATRYERDGATLFAGTSGAADAVRVVLGVVRQVEIKHDLEVVHIEPAGGDVGGDEELEAVPLEFFHRLVALHLGQVAVQSVDGIAARVQVFVELVDHDLGAAKNDAVAKIVQVDQPRQHLELRATVHLVINLVDLRRVGGVRFDPDPGRIAAVTLDHVLDQARHRRREEQQLALLRHGLEDVFDVVAETHVEHPIGLVEDHHFEVVELQRATLHVVHDPAGRADDDLRPGVQRAELPLVTLPAVDRHFHQALLEKRQLAELLRHLHREFARRTEHEHLHAAHLDVDFLDGWDRERRGLAGTGRGLANDIAAR